MSEYITYKNTFQDKPEKFSQYCEYIRAFRKKKKNRDGGPKKSRVCGDCFTEGPICNPSGHLMRTGEYGE